MKTTIFYGLLYFTLSFIFLLPDLSAQSQLRAKEKRGKWGFVIGEKQKVIDYQFDEVKYFRNGLCPVLKNGKWGYIDEKGKTLIPFQYDDAATFIGKSTSVKISDKYGLINHEGIMLTKMVYDTIFRGSKYFMFKQEGLYGLLDSLGTETISKTYEAYNGVYKNAYCIKKNGKWGSIINGVEDFQNDPVFLRPDVMPKFPGCPNNGEEKEWKACSDKELLTFIYKQIRYPAEARRTGVEGTVVISFLVNKNGEVEQAEIVREIGAGCGMECLEIVNRMPKWTPGQHEGEIVTTRFNLPVKFRLE